MNRINVEALESPDPLINEESQVYHHNGQPYNGIVYELFQGRLDLEFEVKNGLKNGIEKEFDEQGRICTKSYYRDGFLDGHQIHYYSSERIQEKAQFEKGICFESTSYDEDGAVTKEERLTPDDPSYTWLMYLRSINKN